MTSCRCGVQSLGFDSCYWHTKGEVDWTTHPPTSNGLSPEARAFVGLYDARSLDGWRPADGWVRSLDPDPDVDLERVAMLRILVGLGDMTEELL